LYTILEIKDDNYFNFINKIKTHLIVNRKVNETIGDLTNVPVEYNLVSEITKKYNFKDGINKLQK
jgi:hypothetical protein